MSIYGELQGFNSGQWVEMYSLDLTPFGGDIMRFYSGTNEMNQPLVWQGNQYLAYPCQVTGFSQSSSGAVSRPKLKLANVNGVISTVLMQSGGIEGARFVRKRTKVKFLDAVNFPSRRNLLLNTSDLSAASWSTATSAPSIVSSKLWRGEYPFCEITKIKTTSSEYRGHQVGEISVGTVLTLSMVLSRGTSTTLSAGIYASTGWGENSDSSARIVSGPGQIARQTGAIFQVSGLTEDYTIIEITRTFVASSASTSAYIYPGGSSSTTVGASVLVAAPQLEIGSESTQYQPIGNTWSQNPTADPSAGLPDDVFYVTRKESEDADSVSFELGPSTDLQGVSIPGRIITASYCPFKYRGEACGYTGGAVATAAGVATTDLMSDRCGKRPSDCKLRFGDTAQLPFGGFPACGLVRFT